MLIIEVEMLKIVSEKYKLDINGTVYEMDFPYADDFDALIEKTQMEENEKNSLKLMRAFFSKHGLPEDVLKVLQIQHYNLIFESMMPKKN